LLLLIATFIALYLGLESLCLYESLCSSSTIIIPIFLRGANIADLAPITIEASPLAILLHSSYF